MDPHISAWSITTGELIGRVGRHGQGPREFRYPDWMLRGQGETPQALVYDFKNRRFTSVSVVSANSVVIDSSFPMQTPVEIERPFPVDNGYLSNVLVAEDVLVLLDEKGNVVVTRTAPKGNQRPQRGKDATPHKKRSSGSNWKPEKKSGGRPGGRLPDRRNDRSRRTTSVTHKPLSRSSANIPPVGDNLHVSDRAALGEKFFQILLRRAKRNVSDMKSSVHSNNSNDPLPL
jgi:hypothetical protein